MIVKHIPIITIVSFAIAAILFANVPVAQAENCASIVTKINNDHKQALDNHSAGTDGLLTALYEVEDVIFDVINGICSKNSSVFSSMGELQLSLGQIPIAQLYAEKALEMDNKNWQAHYVLGSALNLQKKYPKGLKHLQRASELQPTNYALLVNLCSSYEKNELYPNAIKVCSIAIEKGSYEIRGTAHFLRAQAYKGNQETSLAEKDLELAKKFGFNQ